MTEYRLSPAAERDLEAIFIFTAKRWGIEQANRYTDFLIAAFVRLSQSPMRATVCDNIRPGYRRLGVERHVIYFRITSYGIAVVRILHDRMDAQRHL
ncbi:MAG: type II toxin-antitoxin system RelE/ParE family toxin [Gammaproteobacteria bacterium]|nr:type II toxin-antitoxin system RelE/ParE family toxin [Gammaproteobacteria bacterium]MBU1655249.1 type II toxin-antitoxin system RelE/ParE family toxin [Gammaproteobacteria bacterium]MBU1959754.1 type II toxin-antitoxin system RelE/ParE family toxin [Gammaproteobacteria bacterium]